MLFQIINYKIDSLIPPNAAKYLGTFCISRYFYVPVLHIKVFFGFYMVCLLLLLHFVFFSISKNIIVRPKVLYLIHLYYADDSAYLLSISIYYNYKFCRYPHLLSIILRGYQICVLI